MSDGFKEKLADNAKGESNNINNEGDRSGFRSALFINPINYEPDIQIQEINESLENANFFSDSFFSGRTPRSGESMNYKNCLSTDLLKRIDEGSPNKSNRSLRKFSMGEECEEEDEAKTGAKDNQSAHSLFYNRVKDENYDKKYFYQVKTPDKEDHEQDYRKFNYQPSTTVNKKKILNLNEDMMRYHTNMPSNNLRTTPFTNKGENPNNNGIEYSFGSPPLFNDIGYMSSCPNINSNFNNLNVNNLTYEEFLRKKYYSEINNKKNENIFSQKEENICNKKNGFNPEEYDYSSNSTLSTITKKLSPFNDDIAFYPKNFYNGGNGNENTRSSRNVNENVNMNPNYSLNSLNKNNYYSNRSNSRTCNTNPAFNFLQQNNPLTSMDYNSHPNPNINSKPNYNANTNNIISQYTQNSQQNLQNQHTNSGPDYLRSPLGLNLNINKIKKNANLNTINNNNTRNREREKNNFNPREQTENRNNSNNSFDTNSGKFPPINSPNMQANNLNKNYQHGKTGWVCSICRNFNYEARVKCNRCGKPQMKNSSVQLSKTIASQMPNLQNLQSNPNILNNNNVNDDNKMNFNKLLCKSRENLNNNNNVYNCSNLINEPNVNINSNLYDDNTDEISNPSSGENSPQLSGEDANKANSADSKKKKKPFVERVGDWVCIKCKNLNFSFRVICNRCQLTKEESEKLFEQYMKNLMNYVKINELLQNQILTNQNLNLMNSSNRGNVPANKKNGEHSPRSDATDGNVYNPGSENYFTEESYPSSERLGRNNSK